MSVIAQGEAEYRKKMSDYFKTMIKLSNPVSDKKVHHFSYTEKIKTRTQNASSKPLENNVNIYVKKDKYYYYSNNVNVFRDGQDAFVIMHKEKMIFRTNPLKARSDDDQLNHFIKIQDLVFEKGALIEFQELFIKGRKMARLIISTPKELKEELKVNYTTYWYDIEAEKIWKLKIHFSDDYELKTKEIIYKEIDFDYEKKMTKPVFKRVLDKKGNLTEDFKSYQIVNNKEYE